jgi:uncharacterized membrane protein YeaQ/YmgE (transglycosylase-associated protein family)
MANEGSTLLIENILVGAFGGVIGGEFVAAQLNSGAPLGPEFSIGSMLLAVGGAGLALLLLRLMRRVVGQGKTGKKPRRDR